MSHHHSAEENPQAGAGRPLPKKEADLFRSVVKHYETKQYKKAIKQADAILKRFPNHGETLAMKGLTLNYINYATRRDEAHALVKQALTYDMRSHVCWHVYGLLHRSDRNYNEAIKAYKQALRIDPSNLQILRDLSMLQVQMRDLEGFAVTRNTLLSLKSNAKVNWMAFALAKHLCGEHRDAVKVIDIYLGTLTEESEELGRCFESSELALYKNSILAEIPNNYKEALDHLGVCEGIVVDRGAWLMARAQYQLKLRDYVGAKQSVLALLERGMTEDYRVHSLYMCILLALDEELCDEALRLRGTRTVAAMMPLSADQRSRIRDAYTNDLLPRFPNSYAVQTIPISLLEGDELKIALMRRCRHGLRKGVPSLCSELQSYIWMERAGRYVRPNDPLDYLSHPVYSLIVELVDSFTSSLQVSSKFAPQDDADEPQSTLLWAWYLRAGLHELGGQYAEGIALLDKCLEHSPTDCDVYELKARLLKSAGALVEAAECLDKARELDRQDRYINNLTTRYMLQAGMEERALKTISLFAKHEGNPEQNLFDMQCSWYELEVAAHFARKMDWGRSLKKYAAVVKHFDDINEDQFDFHGYCLRKVTLRSYVEVLRFEDEAYGQDYYCQAASGIVRIYLHLMDHPIEDETAEPDYSNMTAAERKKAKAIARKKKKAAERKDEAESAAAAATPDANKSDNGNTKHASSNNKGGKPSFLDQDPYGKELVARDPVEEARRYSAMLTRYAPKRMETWLLCYDVAIRRKKAVMALQSLHKARAIDPTNGDLLERIVDFALKMKDFEGLSDPVQQVLNHETPRLLNYKPVNDFVKDAVASVESDPTTALPFRTAVAKALARVQTDSILQACELITAGGITSRGVTVETCRAALVTLQDLGDEASAAVENWTAQVKALYPLLTEWS